MRFEDFLLVKCMEQPHALDDDLSDVYEAWIVEQDVSDIIKWATEWHNYLLEDAISLRASTPDDIEKLVGLNK